MSLDNALFLVDRGGTNYRSKGSDIGSRMKSGDRVLVQRGTSRFKATYDGWEWTKIRDSDLLLTWDGTNNRRVTGANFKALFPTRPPVLGEWNWIGHSTSTQLYQMCDNGNKRHAFWKSDWQSMYFDSTDRNGQIDMYSKFRQAIQNRDEIWFKLKDNPAVQYAGTADPYFTPYYCSFSIQEYAGLLPNINGLLRWLNTNPDAP